MKKNIIYLFGAGASKDFGMPLGNEIFSQAYQLPRLLEQCQLRTDLVHALRESDSYLRHIFTRLPKKKNDYPPFEEVLTFLWDYRKSERRDYDKNKLISAFTNPRGVKEVFDVFVKTLTLTLSGSIHYAGNGGIPVPLGGAAGRWWTRKTKNALHVRDAVRKIINMVFMAWVSFCLNL
jgi:hypothetical protein